MQLPDGGWNIYTNGPAEVNATIKAYLALKLAGVPVTDPRMLRARETAKNLGGVPRLNTLPPDTRWCGHRPNHDVKCFTLGHRLMSTPISLITVSAVVFIYLVFVVFLRVPLPQGLLGV